jgi:CheY-like chemotaxis protein
MLEDITEKKKILVVDDDEIQLLTAELFLKSDYEVLKMKSGSDVLEYLSSNEYAPDLVLLDIIMPGMDGWQVLKKLKTMDKIKDIPVVFLSVIKTEEEKKKAFNLGITTLFINRLIWWT